MGGFTATCPRCKIHARFRYYPLNDDIHFAMHDTCEGIWKYAYNTYRQKSVELTEQDVYRIKNNYGLNDPVLVDIPEKA